ncbi:SdpI family protein [Vallitalea maricola]|uniref:SdpI family protein n=1 Tax=Vallitalea maricola TaxID=3074433 RepID=A0ACB5UPF4_9FIRM|nr:SdpI family protein [Vallitalea sp. AN17-2]
MKNKLLWIITLLPTIVTCVIIPFMNDKIPMHYDAIGNIDRWGSKYENFIFPVIIIAMTLFWKLILNYFRKKQVKNQDEKTIKEAEQNEKVIYYTAIGMAILFGIMHYAMMYSSILETKNNMENMAIDINLVTNIVMGVFLIIIGNIVPKSKMNSIVGVRTIWSMKNDITWAKSNRFGGISLILSGLLIIFESAFIGGFKSTIVMLAIIIVDGIVLTIYSYQISKKYGEKLV